MQELNKLTRRCSNGGAKCTVEQTYCKSCHEPLPKATVVTVEPMIEGLSDSEVLKYIDKSPVYIYVRSLRI